MVRKDRQTDRSDKSAEKRRERPAVEWLGQARWPSLRQRAAAPAVNELSNCRRAVILPPPFNDRSAQEENDALMAGHTGAACMEDGGGGGGGHCCCSTAALWLAGWLTGWLG